MNEVLAVQRDLRVALVGRPNCGKTALFNALTGSRQKVANYPGVTVERKEGALATPAGRSVKLLDLPGTYSLRARSPDEVVTRDAVLGRLAGEAPPDLFVCVGDATNLRLCLRLALEIRSTGRPMLFALNMIDIARARGLEIDLDRLEAELGVARCARNAQQGRGVVASREHFSPPRWGESGGTSAQAKCRAFGQTGRQAGRQKRAAPLRVSPGRSCSWPPSRRRAWRASCR